MLDVTFTHCSDLNPMVQDVIARHRKSPYFEMFEVLETDDGELEYETFRMICSIPKFATESFKTISFIANDFVKKWMRLGVDAWRLDVANEISDNMLDNIKHVIKDEKKEIYVVGEIWHNATEWISNNALDSITNYAVSRAILAFVCDSTHDIFKYRSAIDELIHSYTKKQLKASIPLLDSHDTPRLRTIVHNDKDKFKLALLLLFTFYGTPSLYYGTERYMEGAGDPDNRRPTNWDDHGADVEDIYHITKLLIQLRHDHPVLANDGELEWIDHNELLIMHRYNDTENLYIIINSKEYDLDTALPMNMDYINIIDHCPISNSIHINRLGSLILKPKSYT